jgi:DNA recombination protein RmuC
MSELVVVLVGAGAFTLGVIGSWLVLRERQRASDERVRSAESAVRDREAFASKAEEQMKAVFASASRDALQENNKLFMDVARASMNEFQQGARVDLETRRDEIDRLVKPVSDGLAKVETVLQAMDRGNAAGSAALAEQVRRMAADQGRLAAETSNLVKALRTPTVRGQWGELQLRRTVELAGMVEHCDFTEQQTVSSEDGRFRPDVVVHLPDRKVIVVDSKAPLVAYLDSIAATDPAERAALLDRHAAHVRAHIDSLATKDYSNLFAESPDFVVMFLPGEAFFSAACEQDPSLLEYAIGRGVMPCSPTTLITLLRAVAYGWQQQRISERAEHIRDVAMELYSRLSGFADHLRKVRKSLDGAVSAYNAAVGTLEGRVLPSARRLEAMGVAGTSTIATIELAEGSARQLTAPEFDSPSLAGVELEVPMLAGVD